MTTLRVTDETLDEHFEGVMIDVNDPFVGGYTVPGWKCLHCGWIIGTAGLPPSHYCPDDGQAQAAKRKQQTDTPDQDAIAP
jgi:hypothetical protein